MEHNFSIGDVVVALSDQKNALCQPRKRGQMYVVQDVSYCAGCGAQRVNAGYPPASKNGFVECTCGVVQHNRGLAWTNSRHFARPCDLEELLADAVECERYEQAAVIRDIIKEL